MYSFSFPSRELQTYPYFGFHFSPRLQASYRSLNIALSQPENSWTYQSSTIPALDFHWQSAFVDLPCAELDPLEKPLSTGILETIALPKLNSPPISTVLLCNQNQSNSDHLTGPQFSAQDSFQQNPGPVGGSTVHNMVNVNADILETVSPLETTEANSLNIISSTRYEFGSPSTPFSPSQGFLV